MKITSVIFVLLLTSCITCFSQTTDFFAGKWEVTVLNSPKGDVSFLTDLIRKDGKLTGELVEKADAASIRKIIKVEESPEKLVVYFESSQGGESILDLKKVDQDNLKGTMHDFEATAKRLK
ncbi:hypothetical protein [Dyadobacter psychrophilus]|uniref:Uncharacterized protein n=1 Tax=Dyadobacter psychrophilus TaxID=651661 RepID=A0A1T5BHP6_9BACT|nr:hypothetical protein [Dyadobacter psychrophilus]SKB46665.1 hypothetical protein SAMN05660293_00351 [Dyadobacter psychrophilus]